jgi:hypothetical protein
MITSKINPAIDSLISDEVAMRDARSILNQERDPNLPWSVYFEDGKIIIPRDAHIEVVGKRYNHWRYDFTYGTNFYHVMLSIGKVIEPEPAALHSEYCFLTLMYDENGKRIDEEYWDKFLD